LLLVVDNGSIYTKQLTDFLSKKNIYFEKFTPHILELNSLQKYESIILSGRKKNDKKIQLFYLDEKKMIRKLMK